MLAGLLVLIVSQAQGQGLAEQRRMRVLLERERLVQEFDTSRVVKNVFKLNPLLLLRGEVPLVYERALTYRLSAEVGVGFTMRNYLAMTFVGDDADDIGAGVNVRFRPSLRAGFRYYMQDELEPQGSYLQLEFAHLAYAKNIHVAGVDGHFTQEKYLDERIYNDLRLLVGYQQLSRSSNWLYDLYGGFGYRVKREHVVMETYDLINGGFTYATEERTAHVPVVFLGVKLGLGF